MLSSESSQLTINIQPFNAAYEWFNETNMVIADSDITIFNTYKGGVFQQATSGVTNTSEFGTNWSMIMTHAIPRPAGL